MNLEILFLSLLKEHTLVICGFGAIVTSGLILLDQEDLDLNICSLCLEELVSRRRRA